MRESPPCVVHEARPAACITTGSVPSPLPKAARTVRRRARSIDAFYKPAPAPRRCRALKANRPDGRHAGAWPAAARKRPIGCSPCSDPSSMGQSKRQNGWTDVVFGLTTLPFALDREAGSSEHSLNPLLQFLTDHSEHLQLPITRCYLLLQRTLGHADGATACTAIPSGSNSVRSSRAGQPGESPGPGLVQAGIEVLAHPTRTPWAGPARSSAAGGGEALGEGHRQPAAPQRPFPHAGHVAVAGEADLARSW
jgi:hypothetical protein